MTTARKKTKTGGRLYAGTLRDSHRTVPATGKNTLNPHQGTPPRCRANINGTQTSIDQNFKRILFQQNPFGAALFELSGPEPEA